MSPIITTAKDKAIIEAAALLQKGALICFPTETVYALAADSTNDSAITALYAAKGRALDMPLAVLVATIEEARKIALFDVRAEKLAHLWPGPLTLVLPARKNNAISPLLNRGGDSIAIRIPDNEVALSILRAFGRPVAATSTNISGFPSAISVQDIDCTLKEHIAFIIDDGPSRLKKGSTIIDLCAEEVRFLREGDISYDEIGALL